MSAIFNRENVISELWRSKDVAAAIAKMEPTDLQDDLRQELFVVLCEMDEEKLRGLHERGELRWFVVRIILNMAKSDRSTFYNLHRKFAEEILSGTHLIAVEGEVMTHKTGAEDIPIHKYGRSLSPMSHDPHTLDVVDWADYVEDAVDELDDYEASMIRLYVDMGYNCAPIAKATGIQVRSVRYAVSQAKEKLQKRLRSHAA